MNGQCRIVRVAMLGIFISLLLALQPSMAGEKGSQKLLYVGLHHVALYPSKQADTLSIAKWYEKYFDFKFRETPTAYFAARSGAASLEIMKGEPEVRGHLAILVNDFEAARKDLESKGLELTPTGDLGPVLVTYIKGTDPAGYKVHLIYIKK